MKSTAHYIRKIFTDKEGKVVIGQTPNIPIISWAIFTVLATVLTDGKLQTASEYIAFGSIFTWAWLELFQGVSTFRRMLGAVVLFAVVWSKIN